jgi:hypothetical protein
MDRNDIMEKLRAKLEKNLAEMKVRWCSLPSRLAVGRADEISAAKAVFNELHSGVGYTDRQLEYLLRFENPLEAVRDRWLGRHHRPDIRDEMNETLFDVMNSDEVERQYAQEKSCSPPEMEQTFMPVC